MRPLFLAPYGDFGGSESVLLRLIDRLGEAIEPEAVVMSEGKLAGRLEVAGVPSRVVHLPGKRSVARLPFVARQLAPELEGRGFTFIHANGTKAAILGIRLARSLGIPIVWMKHDHAYEGPLTRTLAARCTRVICVSQAMADLLGPRVRDRVVVAYPGVELDPSPPTGPSPPVVISVGRMDPRKGFMELIDAVAILRANGRDHLRLVIGGPDYPPAPGHREALQAHADAAGFADHAQIGWIDDIDTAYREARVVAMTSRRMRGRPAEGAPLVLMEGMSHGLPAVGPNEGGIAEVVGDAGTLVDDRTPEGYARALEPYVDLPEMSREVGERGHERVRRLFTFDGTVERVRAVYEDLDRLGRAAS
jgi:colanic acid/amylovoran biosynthesis glycosyltransferase